MNQEYIDDDFSPELSHYKAPDGLAKGLVVVLIVMASFKFISFCLAIYSQFIIGDDLFNVHEKDFDRVRFTMLSGQMLAGLSYLILLAVVIMYHIWSYRAYKNVFYSAQLTNWSPFWSSLGWFVPFLNYFVPGLILSRIWTISQDKAIEDKRLKMGNEIVWVWWTLFLIGGVIFLVSYGQVFFPLFNNNHLAGDFISLEGSVKFIMYANILDLFLSMFTYSILAFIVKKIHSFEQSWNQKYQGSI